MKNVEAVFRRSDYFKQQPLTLIKVNRARIKGTITELYQTVCLDGELRCFEKKQLLTESLNESEVVITMVPQTSLTPAQLLKTKLLTEPLPKVVEPNTRVNQRGKSRAAEMTFHLTESNSYKKNACNETFMKRYQSEGLNFHLKHEHLRAVIDGKHSSLLIVMKDKRFNIPRNALIRVLYQHPRMIKEYLDERDYQSNCVPEWALPWRF